MMRGGGRRIAGFDRFWVEFALAALSLLLGTLALIRYWW